MTHYKTCTGCAVDRKTCKRLLTVKAAVAGLSITTVGFRCPERVDKNPIGSRVKALVRYSLDGESYAEDFHGTVVGHRGPRVLVEMDADAREVMTNQNGFGKFSRSMVSPIPDTPLISVCTVCQSASGLGCYGQSGHTPDGCLRGGWGNQ